MKKSSGRLDHFTTLILVTVIVAMATIIVRREFFAPEEKEHLSGEVLPSPTFAADWASLRRSGVTVGDTMAKIQVVEFIDLQCPACRSMHRSLESARAKYGSKVAITYIHFPLEGIHPHALAGARAAQCANQFGAIDKFINAAFAKQDSIGRRTWDAYRRDAGVSDSTLFTSCVVGDSSLEKVRIGLRAGNDFGVAATPTVIINGWTYQGALSKKALDTLIFSLLRDAPPPGLVDILGSPSASANRQVIDGVPTVLYRPEELELSPRMKLSAVPISTIGEDESSEDVSFVGSAELMEDGQLFALSQIGGNVMLFPANGRGGRPFARRGRGPNELGAPRSIARVSKDTIVIFDASNHRLHRATAGRGIEGGDEIPAQLLGSADQVAGALSDHSFILFRSGRFPLASTLSGRTVPYNNTTPVHVWSPGKSLSKIADIEDGQFALVTKNGRQRVEFLRLSARAHVVVWDSVIATSSARKFQIDLRKPDGRIVASVGIAKPRRPVTAQLRKDFTELETSMVRNTPWESGSTPRSGAIPKLELLFADSLPAFQSLHVTDGILWIVDAIGPSDTEWTATALRLDGSIAGRLRALGGAVPIAFHKDRVVVRATGADDAITLRTFRIVPDRLN